MDVVSDLPADPQAAEPVQVGERPLHDPALGAQAGAVLGAAPGDQWFHTEIPHQAAIFIVVVASVAPRHVRSAPVTSLRLPPVRVAASGMPVTSVIR